MEFTRSTYLPPAISSCAITMLRFSFASLPQKATRFPISSCKVFTPVNRPFGIWFHLNFGGNSSLGDDFWYEGWEGHFNLVKLNLQNPQVVEYLFSCIRGWVEQFDIDGLRLDVAYLLDHTFLRQLRSFCDSLKPDFFLIGEAIHGDYNRIVNNEMLHSCTNYECFKGIFSSFNDRNMFEIAYSLNRQFGPEHWTIYKGLPLFNFVDNHDVARIASSLKEPRNLKVAYGLLFGMPGIPCIYYGSEWGASGEKIQGSDAALRPNFAEPEENGITEWIALLSKIRLKNPALGYGDYRQLYLTNLQYAFSREYHDNRIVVAINAAASPHMASIPDNENEIVHFSSGYSDDSYCTNFFSLVAASYIFIFSAAIKIHIFLYMYSYYSTRAK